MADLLQQLGLQRRAEDYLAPSAPTAPIPSASPLNPSGMPASDPLNQPGQAQPAPMPDYASNQYAEGGSAGEFERGTHAGVEDTVAGLKNIKGLAQLGLGKRADAIATFQDAKVNAERATAEGPHTASFSEAKKTGDYAGYAAGMAGEALPTLASLILPGGAGAKIGTKVVEKGVERVAEKFAAREAERALVSGATKEAAADVATAAKTAATKRLAPMAEGANETAIKVGEAAGTTLGGLPGSIASSTEQLANAKPEDLNTTAAKVGIGSLISSAVGAVPAVRLLDKVGQEAVASTAERFLPRVAKEVVKQGSIAGVAGVAQTATTLATHKWVGDNVDLLSPASFDQYLDSLVGGGAIGGITGGGVAMFKGGGVPHLNIDGIKKTLKDNFDNFSKKPVDENMAPEGATPNSMKAFMEAHDTLKGTSAEAADVFNASFKHGDDAQQSVVDALHKAYAKAETKTAKQAIMREMGKYADDEVATETQPGEFSSRADEAMQRIDNHDQVDSIVDDAHASHERFMNGAEPMAGEAPRYTNPVPMDTPMQNMLAAHIPRDHPIWQFPDAVRSVAESTAKMLSTGEELTPKDTANINTMRQLVGDRTVAKWKAVGPEFAKLTEVADRVSKGAEEDSAPQSHVTTQDDAHEPTQGVFEKSLRDMPHNELSDQLTAAQPGTPEHAALKSEMKTRLLDGVLTESKKGSGPAFFEKKSAQPGTVEIAGVKTQWGPRRRLVDVGNMIGKELLKNPGDGKGAVAKVMGDLALAGVKVKPESIKAGVWYASKDGSSTVRVSPRQAAELRGQLAKPAMTPEAKAVGAKRIRSAEQQRQADIATNPKDVDANRPDTNGVPREEQQHLLTPKEQPPGDKGGGIADVSVNSPYDKVVNKALVTKGTPKERADARHEAGVRIGSAELKATETNPRTLARKLAALNDRTTGESKRYFNRAKRGELDSTSVRETKADEAKPSGRDKTQADRLPESKTPDAVALKAKQKETSKESAQVNRNDARRAELEAKDKAGALKPHEQSQLERMRSRDAKLDDDINVGFNESQKPSGHDTAKETKMVHAVLDRIAFKGPKLTVRAPRAGETVSGGRWEPKTNEVIIADHLTGPERVEVIAHEVGHHVIMHELGESLEKATPELRNALVADYHKWLKTNFSGTAKVSDVLASRKAFFRATKIEEGSSGMRVSDPGFRQKMVGDKPAIDYLYDMHEYLADQFSRALTQSEPGQGVIGKFFHTIAQRMREVYDTMFGGDRAKYAPAESVDKWVKSLFDRNADAVREATGQSVPPRVAENYVRAAQAAAHPSERGSGTLAGSDDYRATKDYVEHTLSPDERGILSRALDRRPIEASIRAAFAHDAELMSQLEKPDERIATQFFLANKLFGEGKLDLRAKGPLEAFLHLRNGLLRLAGIAGNNDKAMQLFIDTRNGDIKAARKGGIEKGKGGYDVDARVNPGKKIQEAFNAATKMYWSQVFHPFRRIEYGPGNNVHFSYTPALSALGAKLKLHTGESGNDHGYLPSVEAQRHLFNTDAGRALGHLEPDDKRKVNQLLQTRTPLSAIADGKLRKAVADTRTLMRKALGYARDAGVKLNEYGKDYYPTFVDGSEVAKREGDFRALISQPKFEAALREVTGDVKSTHAELIERLTDYAKKASGDEITNTAVDPLQPPEFRSMNTQVFKAIYDHGTPDEISKFASFQKGTPDEIITPYMHALVKRAEFARRFGDDGAKIKTGVEEARKQGVHEADLKHFEDYIASATGAYGADGSPIVRKFFGDKAGKWFGRPSTKAGISMLMAYENVRLLPLALLSSLADPMGIGVRYGGMKSMKDAHQAWKSFNDGFRAMSKKMDATGLQEQARIIGMADDYMKSDIAINGYSPGLEGFARKISDAMFKANGLNWFIKSTRYMALSAANAFLLKHAAHLDPKHSARYLQELGVKPGDIRTAEPGRVKLLGESERGTASKAQLEADDRVRNALNRFVNESILRTDASQHPVYMNDPAFRLITQYKQFGHAFSDQIIDRIIQEAHYSNFHVFGPAVGYIPVTAVGEMARAFVQYGPSGNPNQADWDALDWAAFAGNRSGLLGPRIQQGLGLVEGKAYAGMGRMVELGPTGEQLEDVLSTLQGHRSVDSLVVESLPAGNVLKHW